MKSLLAFIFLTVCFSSPIQNEDLQRVPLSEILSDREYADYQRKNKYKDRIDIFRRVLNREAIVLRGYMRTDRVEQSLESLQRIRAIACYIREEPIDEQKDLRSNQVKDLEIGLRGLIEVVRDLRVSAPFEARVDFEAAAKDLDDLRSFFLKGIFGSSIINSQDHGASLFDVEETFKEAPVAVPHLFYATHAAVRRRVVNLQTADRFTEEEYRGLQENQKLVKRVETFLEIAESRLVEIKRRINDEPWKDDKPNPLEFYTYEDMVHAYERAIDGIMINIDEKARYKTADGGDIKKSLEKLNEKIQEFIPQLEAIENMARKIKDSALHKEVLSARKTSEIALKGSQYGLGAPVE
ncbi:MAG: hypothetical protein ACRD1R_02575 [Acidobacteriota bacterium]